MLRLRKPVTSTEWNDCARHGCQQARVTIIFSGRFLPSPSNIPVEYSISLGFALPLSIQLAHRLTHPLDSHVYEDRIPHAVRIIFRAVLRTRHPEQRTVRKNCRVLPRISLFGQMAAFPGRPLKRQATFIETFRPPSANLRVVRLLWSCVFSASEALRIQLQAFNRHPCFS